MGKLNCHRVYIKGLDLLKKYKKFKLLVDKKFIEKMCTRNTLIRIGE